jgi:hypothetical protein
MSYDIFLVGITGVVIIEYGKFIYSRYIDNSEWEKQQLSLKKQEEDAQAIEITAFRCFNDKDRSKFSSDARDLFIQGTLRRDTSVILMKERWEKTGKWAKALQSQCHEDGTERR